MLKFLRRYQKLFFIIIAVIVVVTFSFFGTQGITAKASKIPDKTISKAYDGSDIKLSDIESMSYFLSTDNIDSSIGSRISPNLFNDGVIRNEFLRSGIAKIFIEKYFDRFNESFKSKFEKIKKYKPFVHFNDSSISLEKTLQMIDPKVLTLLKEIQNKQEINMDFFNCYIELYNEQAKIQPELLRKILIYQERQKKVQPDTRLYQDSIALFGFESIIDWFGKDLVDLVSQFIINTAAVAKEKGYVVTGQEVLADMMSNLRKSLNNQMNGSIADNYKKMLACLRMDERKAASIWKNVLLYRKYFKDVSNNTLLDSLAYREFADFSSTKASIKLYKLPGFLQMKKAEDLLLFEMYLLATAKKSNPLDVPNIFLTAEEIEKKYPELIEKKYLVNVKQTNEEKAALKVKTKDMCFWQLEDKNWQKLKNKFSFISKANTKNDRLNVIEQLDGRQKEKIDTFSRCEIVNENFLLIDESLLNENEVQYEFCFSKETSLPIQIKDPDKLFELLEKQDKIEKYTQDNKNYFSIAVVQRPEQKNLVTFEKALKNNIIDKILDDYLESQDPSKFEEEKDFDRVKLGQIVFKDVFDKLKSLNITKDQSLDAFAQNRFYLFLDNIKQKVQKNENYLEGMNPQFAVECKNIEVSRSKNQSWLEKTAFAMEEKNYSLINQLDNGNLGFFYLESFKKADILSDKIDVAKHAIFDETSSLLTRKLIKTFMEKDCIVIPIRETIDPLRE